MKAVGVIPARFGSSRFPGKPLALISGEPMISWVIRAVQEVSNLDEVAVVTDHEEIATVARRFGARALMTPSDCPSGTDRIWAAYQKESFDIALNIQGDEPLIQPRHLESLVQVLKDRNDIDMASLGRELQDGDLENQNTAKIVLNQKNEAIYFSRLPIPYSRTPRPSGMDSVCLKHIGVYGYKRNFLEKFCLQKPVDLEKFEGLEQLRALYLGGKIHILKVEAESWGVDHPEDIEKIESLLKERWKETP